MARRSNWLRLLAVVVLVPVCVIAGADSTPMRTSPLSAPAQAAGSTATPSPIRTVFVVVMENTDWSQLQGNTTEAPYVNSLISGSNNAQTSYATQYYNPPRLHPSLSNYLWLESGQCFTYCGTNYPPQQSPNGIDATHLVSLLDAAGISWKNYSENYTSGVCPMTSSGFATDPFVYFDDVNSNAEYCTTHLRSYNDMASDLANNTGARYNFITPSMCDNMHDSCAPLNDPIKQGDNWLSTVVPQILNSQAYKNDGVLFITWDEAVLQDGPIGMLVVSPDAKGKGYSNAIHYSHSSTLRTVQEIFGVGPLLGDANNATDLSDLFTTFPEPLPTVAPSATLTSTSTPPPPTPDPARADYYRSTVLADNPVSFWELGEASGTTSADSGSGGNAGSIMGGVTLGASGAITGSGNTGMSFDGSTGHINVQDNPDLDMTGDLTLEAWAKPTTLDGMPHAIIHKGSYMTMGAQYRMSLSSANRWRGLVYVGGSWFSVQASAIASTVGWTYLALTRSGSTLTLYVNGVAAAVTRNASGALNTGARPLTIGRSGSDAVDYFNGGIDEVAVYNAALSPAQIQAHFTAGTAGPSAPTLGPTDTPTNTPVVTDTATDTPVPPNTPTNTPVPTATATDTPVPPTATDTPAPTDTPTNTPVPTYTQTIAADGPISYWRLGERGGTMAVDSSTGGNNGAVNGGTVLGVPGALIDDSDTAMSFDGTSGYVRVPDNANLDMTGDFTVEAWVKPASLGTATQSIVQKGDSWCLSSNGYQYGLILAGSQWKGIICSSQYQYTLLSNATVSTTDWTYLAFERSGNTLQLYVNGQPSVSKTIANLGAINSSTRGLSLGRLGGQAPGQYFNGAIDEVAIYNRSLSPEQVQAHYSANH